jgi:hypothetical protein
MFQQELFNSTQSPIIGLSVDLTEDFGGKRCCGNQIAEIHSGKGPHVGEFRCVRCGRHRGWLSKSTAEWIEQVIESFGRPTDPIKFRRPTNVE